MNIFSGHKLEKDSSYLIYFLLSIIILAYIIPIIVFFSPAGTDVYTHMYNTLRMSNSNSLVEFYDISFKEESLGYDYPFGLWFFGSIVIKVTGMDVNQLVYIITLILSIVSILLYYIYANRLLESKNAAIISLIFLISMPLLSISMLNYSTSRFVTVILIALLFISLNRFNLSSVLITGMLVFSLVFTHTGTYMFLLFFSIVYFVLYALIWKKFDRGVYILILNLLIIYFIAVQMFPYIQPQYIDKGRLILSISESISSKVGLSLIKEMGVIFYDKIFVANNLTYVIFWSCFIFAAGKLSLYIHSRFEKLHYGNFLAIPIIGNIRNISHSVTIAPFWLGPVQSILSIFGFMRLDSRGKCIALSLFITALFPGAMQSGEGTGALREIYYLFLIIPLCSAAGFYYVLPMIKKFLTSKVRKVLVSSLVLLIFLPMISAPIIGSLYYLPTISGTLSEKENLLWLGKIGNPTEGVPDFSFRERIDLYANKLTPDIPSGLEKKRYLDDLRNTYFQEGAEEYTKDLYSFNIKYLISSDRTLKGFEEDKTSLRIDSNEKLDKIFSSDYDFSFYKYVTPLEIAKNLTTEDFNLDFDDKAPKLKYFGSTYVVENDFYKIKLGEASPDIKYIGTPTKNLLAEGGFSDYITITWGGVYKDKFVSYNLNELRYFDISMKDNKIKYKAIVRDENNTENWATVIVEYVFYEKAMKREITIANDWVNSESDLNMNLAISNLIFAPISDFEFYQIGYKEDKLKARKIYPSQDSVILKDKKFDELYLNESDTGLFIKFGDTVPFPTRLSYQGSTIYDYGSISVDTRYSLSPSESNAIIQFFSVGDKTTARNNVQHYSSVSPYFYPEAAIPVTLIGSIDNQAITDKSSNIYNEFQNENIKYSAGITEETKANLQNDVTALGHPTFYEKLPYKKEWTYKSFDSQNEEVKKVKDLNLEGLIIRAFKYNLDTIKALSENNIAFAEAFSVPAPYMEFYREGLRHPKLAYYQGNKTGVVLIPETSPQSNLLRPDFDVDEVFSQWNNTISSIIEDGGMAVFYWNTEDIGDPNFINRIMDLIRYAKSKGVTFMTPNEIVSHYKLIQKVSTSATRGIDYVILDSVNNNNQEIKGMTYRLDLPVINYACSYSAVNGRIPRQEMVQGACRIYVSFDLNAGERKEVKVEPSIPRKTIKLDLSDVYQGRSTITVKDEEENPVAEAGVYVDAKWFESDDEGKIELMIGRGIHKIKVEKPGFVSREYEIEVKGRIFKLLGYRPRDALHNESQNINVTK